MAIRSFDDYHGHEAVYRVDDEVTGLRAVIAIHSTTMGPALGGTRYLPYRRDDDAVADALRLSRAMTYKNVLAGAPAGGGKAVLIADSSVGKTPALLAAYGALLNRLGDVFGTGEDVGFSVADCEEVRRVSPFIAGTDSAGSGNPAVHTALGVLEAIVTTAERLFGTRDLAGRRIAVQGLGAVGSRLAAHLHDRGAELTVADVDPALVDRAVAAWGAHPERPERIHAADVDVFSPCALGGVLHDGTIGDLRCRAIVGAANNQLARADLADALGARSILWAPDFVVSAGGILGAFEEVARMPGRPPVPDTPLDERLRGIGVRLGTIFDRAESSGVSTHAAAVALAESLLAAARR